jgi:hypothetical protein
MRGKINRLFFLLILILPFIMVIPSFAAKPKISTKKPRESISVQENIIPSVLKIAVANFKSPSSNKEIGRLVANAVSMNLKTQLNDLIIIDPAETDSLLKTNYSAQVSSSDINAFNVKDVGRKLGIDIIIVGEVLKASAERHDSSALEMARVITSEEDIMNPEFRDWLILNPRPTEDDIRNAPPRTVKKREYSLIHYKKGTLIIDASVSFSYNIYNTKTGLSLMSDKVSGNIKKENKYQDGVPIANIPSIPITIKETDLINELTNEKVVELCHSINNFLSVNIASMKGGIPATYTPVSKNQESAIEKKKASPPIIIISYPEVKRGVKLKTTDKIINVIGKVTDDHGIASIKINGKSIIFDGEGTFSSEILLKRGDNNLVINALNTRGMQATERISIAYDEGKIIREVQSETKKNIMSSGHYYALVIGNNDYRYLSRLQTAVNDAKVIGRLLEDNYGFETQILINAKRRDILSSMNEYRKKLNENDHFLIYYAGHGEYDKDVNKAYWLAVDAQRDDPSDWIIADDITSNIKRLSSRHVLIVSDSCYSGTIDRSVETDLKKAGDRDEFVRKMMTRPSRTLMASGGNEPVSDSGGSGHSIFADSFIKALEGMESKAFTADELFYRHIRSRVAGKSDQVPEYKEIRNSGHEGGDFVFIKKP